MSGIPASSSFSRCCWGGIATLIWLRNAWDCDGNYDDGDGVEWGCFLHDNWRTQHYDHVVPVGVGDDDIWADADKLVLEQNLPNPFNPVTTISFSVPPDAGSSRVELRVYAVDGSVVRTLLDESVGSGRRSVIWDGLDERGRAASSGVYFYRLSIDGESSTKKMVLLK